MGSIWLWQYAQVPLSVVRRMSWTRHSPGPASSGLVVSTFIPSSLRPAGGRAISWHSNVLRMFFPRSVTLVFPGAFATERNDAWDRMPWRLLAPYFTHLGK